MKDVHEMVRSSRNLEILELTLQCDNHWDLFFQALAQSLEVNTSLWTSIRCDVYADDEMAKQYLPRIRYLLSINRFGLHSMVSAIYFLLHLGPNLG
jgi:hypothetical protein